MSEERSYWRKCATCGKEIPYRGIYQKCSVSSCRKSVWCSVDCWDIHNPVMNHKNSWAEEETAPAKETEQRAPIRKIVSSNKPSTTTSAAATAARGDIPKDVLIVASKLKAYVKAKYDLNTSGNVMDALSEIVRHEADKACERAIAEGRKTLMDRDF